jgi:hypothetical protein
MEMNEISCRSGLLAAIGTLQKIIAPKDGAPTGLSQSRMKWMLMKTSCRSGALAAMRCLNNRAEGRRSHRVEPKSNDMNVDENLL